MRSYSCIAAVGKGPTKTKTYALDDMILCVLEGPELPLEKTLRERGNTTLVHELRGALYAAVNDECPAIIERETGRRVKTVLSQFDPDQDVECKVAFLDSAGEPPTASPQSSRLELHRAEEPIAKKPSGEGENQAAVQGNAQSFDGSAPRRRSSVLFVSEATDHTADDTNGGAFLR